MQGTRQACHFILLILVVAPWDVLAAKNRRMSLSGVLLVQACVYMQ